MEDRRGGGVRGGRRKHDRGEGRNVRKTKNRESADRRDQKGIGGREGAVEMSKSEGGEEVGESEEGGGGEGRREQKEKEKTEKESEREI